jgi:hypothetical protein
MLSALLTMQRQMVRSIYGSKDLLLDFDRFFSFLILYSRQDSLDGGSARRKAAIYTQNNTNTE